VGRKYRGENGEYLVEVVDMNIGHAVSPNAVIGSAVMAFPSRESGAVRSRITDESSPREPPNPEMPAFAKALMGESKISQRKIQPLSADEFHLWCECLEDWNPLYWDAGYAASSRHGGLIAPPTGNFLGIGSSADSGVGDLKPGEEVPVPVRNGLSGLALLKALRENLIESLTSLRLPDYPEIVAVSNRADFFRSARVGDSLHHTQEVIDCSVKKKTRLGEGYFLTRVESVLNQRNELVKTLTRQHFYYSPTGERGRRPQG
jgi:acyl dehydratase